MNVTNCDVMVIGGGPSGLSAAINAASEGLRVLLVEASTIGGQARVSKAIENFVGQEKITGAKLMDVAIRQCYKFGVEFRVPVRIVSLTRREDGLICAETDDGQMICCKTVILALGVSYRTLDAKGIGMFINRGVEYTAMPTPGKGTHIIVGGANSAGQAAVYLGSQYGCDVKMVVRGSSLTASMSKYLIERIEACDNIEVLTQARVVEVIGRSQLEKVSVEQDGQILVIPTKSMNVFIGAIPKTHWLKGVVGLDSKGFVSTGIHTKGHGWSLERPAFPFETSFPGVFCAGDARDGSIKRVAAAVGEGSAAVSNIHQYLALCDDTQTS